MSVTRRGDDATVDEGLASDPRFLSDARLLAGLHAELARAAGAGERRGALLRAGFLHGLRDASRGGRAPLGEGSPWMASPALAMRLTGAVPGPGGAGRPLALAGSWPARLEAEAVILACGRSAQPSCLLSAGYTSGWLSALWDADVLVVERTCAARGDDACSFEVRDTAGWAATADPTALLWIPALPFGLLRDRVARERREAGAVEDADPTDAFDPGSPAVHVWGPVMVVPYAGDETAVAVEAVSRQPAAAGVTVVVVDLQGAIVDDGFGAVALERVVEVIEARGAEPVLAGISPLSARVVAGLGRGPVVSRKDLRSAIALAFQIAESQRHAV
jgi:anti-anti-sigma regulatory factor